jgi:hypothetical protein
MPLIAGQGRLEPVATAYAFTCNRGADLPIATRGIWDWGRFIGVIEKNRAVCVTSVLM